MSFEKQRNIITRTLGEDNVRLLTATKAILAGGAITSIFSGNEINDFDIYFRKMEDLIVFIRNAYRDTSNLSDLELVELKPFSLNCVSYTNRSITFSSNCLKIQLIHFDYFDSIQKIFDSFDFYHNMGAYDFGTSEFVLDSNFLSDVAERRINFNPSTKYPIMSTLRVSKYTERGYNISKKEMFKIALAVAKLNIESWEELEDQLSGFYGVDIKKMFDHTQEFSTDAAIRMLDLVEELPNTDDFHPTIKDLLFNIEGSPIKDQRIFFKQVRDNRINEFSTGYTITCDNMEVCCDVEEAESSIFYVGTNYQIAVLQLVDGNVGMVNGNIVLNGSVKVLHTIQTN